MRRTQATGHPSALASSFVMKEHQSLLRGVHMLVDVLLLGWVFWAVHAAQNGVRVELGLPTLLPFESYGLLGLAAAVGWVVVLHVTGAYYSYRTLSFGTLAWMLARSGAIVAVLLGFGLFAVKDHVVSRGLIFGFVPAGVAALVVERLVVKRTLESMRRRDYNLRYLLVVGTGPTARSLVEGLQGNATLGVKVVGCLRGPGELDDDGERADGLEVLGTADDLEQILGTRTIDEVAFALDGSSSEQRGTWLRLCSREGVKARMFFLPPDLVPSESYLEHLNGMPSVSLGMPPSRAWQLAVKRGIDLVVASAALVLSSPILAAAAAAIRLSGPGPVLFRQERYGLNKRTFELLKFRTMVPDAEQRQPALASFNEMDGPVFKMRNDPRVTRVGRVLRATSIDELPQLVNVLLGQMSLVGPRPPIPAEVEQYEPWQRRRLSMKPGITGPWQVNGRNHVDFERWMSMDMDYVDNWTLTKDLEILLKTVPAVVRGVGAW